MPVKKLYSVYDSAAAAYLPVMTFRTHGEAMRAFRAAAQQEGHDFCRHAADYHLFFIGEFDEDTGVIEPAVHHSLGCAIEFVADERQPKLEVNHG